jgi:hypothetical protein
MRSAYYSRANSFSRSYNAHVAEEQGRLPKSRAAKKLNISVPAFEAACKAINYFPTEWHHVGKYAKRVVYYDTDWLQSSQEFWENAANFYNSKIKKIFCQQKAENAKKFAAEQEEQNHREFVEKFRQKLIQQRDCSREVKKHNPHIAWKKRCQKFGVFGLSVPEYDIEKLNEAKRKFLAEKNKIIIINKKLMKILRRNFIQKEEFVYCGLGLKVLLHNNCQSVNIYGIENGINLKQEKALKMLEEIKNNRI